VTELRSRVDRLLTRGTSYQGAMNDLTEVLQWARSRLETAAGTTHWDTCWRHHLECAVQRCETLEAMLAELAPSGSVAKRLRAQSGGSVEAPWGSAPDPLGDKPPASAQGSLEQES